MILTITYIHGNGCIHSQEIHLLFFFLTSVDALWEVVDECLEKADLTRRFVEEDLHRLNWNERRSRCRFNCFFLNLFSNFMLLKKALTVINNQVDLLYSFSIKCGNVDEIIITTYMSEEKYLTCFSQTPAEQKYYTYVYSLIGMLT